MAEGAPRWVFTPEDIPAGEDFYAMGADLLPTTLLTAYASGVFPMPTSYAEGVPMGWWSPDPRGVLLPGDLRISRSLRRSLNKYTCTVDAAFDRVMCGCADPTRDGLWITAEVQAAYRELHRSGHAHSVEVWLDGDVVGGLYGVALGGFQGHAGASPSPDLRAGHRPGRPAHRRAVADTASSQPRGQGDPSGGLSGPPAARDDGPGAGLGGRTSMTNSQ